GVPYTHRTWRVRADLEVIAAFHAASQALAEAQAHFNAASPDAIKAARDDLDRAGAELRVADRKLGAVLDAARKPKVPDVKALLEAEQATKSLVTACRPNNHARALEMAIHQGASLPSPVTKFFVVYEPLAG